jgi:prepilin-type N-terminal cleavage/methylation domain-containing protein
MSYPNRHRHASRAAQAGFTLLELALVVFLIGLVAAMAVPQILPIIAFSELEGSARHIAGFGRGAMAQSALLRDRIVVRVDLKTQEIYAVHWIVEETEEEKKLKEAEPDQLAKLAQLKEKGIRSAADLDKSLLQGGELGSLLSGKDGAFDEELAGYQMSDKFNNFARQALETRAENVKHDESFLEDVGEIFGAEEVFDLDEKEPVEEELGDPILRRTKLREGVTITGIDLDGDHISKGVVEIEFTVLGLAQKAVFYIENEDGDAFTVLWDPVSGRTNIFPGLKEDV